MRNRLVQGGIAALILGLLAVAAAGLAGGSRPASRAYRIEQELRCPVCQSVSIAESPSQTAQVMRAEVVRQVRAGRSGQQIIGYFRARYGDWVVLDPPARGVTLGLWLLPLIAAITGIAALLARARHSRAAPPPVPVPDRERVAAAVAAIRAQRPGDADQP